MLYAPPWISAQKIYLLDLDGTIYQGNEALPYAIELITSWLHQGVRFLMITNNASKSPQELQARLLQLGFPLVPEEAFFTSAMATAGYLRDQRPQDPPTAFVIGTPTLHNTLQHFQINTDDHQNKVDYVVVGIDPHLNYQRGSQALRHLLQGSRLIGTNSDRRIPTDTGYFLGNGAIVEMLGYSSHQEPQYCGKPSTIMFHQLLKQRHLSPSDLIMIGDNLETDIHFANTNNIPSIMVLTGVHHQSDISKLHIEPTLVIPNLKFLLDLFQKQ